MNYPSDKRKPKKPSGMNYAEEIMFELYPHDWIRYCLGIKIISESLLTLYDGRGAYSILENVSINEILEWGGENLDK